MEKPVLIHLSFDTVWAYVDLSFFYQHYFGLRFTHPASLKKVRVLQEKVDTILRLILDKNLIDARGIYQFFSAKSNQNDIIIFDENNHEIQTFHFPRKTGRKIACLADLVSSKDMDSVAFFVCSCGGTTLMKAIQDLQAQGSFVESHILSCMSLAAVEGLAEYLHAQIRSDWQIQDPPYQGLRVSFGYPLCPDLSYQGPLWELLHPDQFIGVSLTPHWMMSPEASISAMVFRKKTWV